MAVDLGPPAAVPHFGMDMVGKVHRGGAGLQVHHVAIRGEHIDPVADQAMAQLVHHGVRAVLAQLLMPFEYLA